MSLFQAFGSLPFPQQAGLVALLTLVLLAVLVSAWSIWRGLRDEPGFGLWPDGQEERMPPSISQYIAREDAKLTTQAKKGFDRKLRAVTRSGATTPPSSAA